MAESEESGRHLLLDPAYWIPRLKHLSAAPCGLIEVPRDELLRAGTLVVELRLRAHDGAPMRALMARSTFHKTGLTVQIRLCGSLDRCAIDWRVVERGVCDVVFPHLPNRRLEDRVLDVLRLATALRALLSVQGTQVELWSGHQAPPDEFVIADLVRERGWA